MDKIKYYDRPFLFYFLCTFTAWMFWGIAAKLSHMSTPHNALCGFFLMVGVSSPAVIAWMLMKSNKKLHNVLLSRLFIFTNVKRRYIILACSSMPIAMIFAQLISLFFGYRIEQFSLSHEPSFSSPILSVWMILFLAPVIEEIAWHSYGTDCLRAKFNLFLTCMIFSFFWALWHLPLSFVKGYYQSNLLDIDWVHSLNFSLSIFPFVFIINWLYYKSGRSILIAIIFHASGNFSSEVFSTHPDTKIIFTIILMIFSSILIYKEKNMFFNKSI